MNRRKQREEGIDLDVLIASDLLPGTLSAKQKHNEAKHKHHM
jgi:hypothetical protein